MKKASAYAEWVNTLDKLPNERTKVLIATDNGVQTAKRITGYFGSVLWESTVDGSVRWSRSEVTHWMPLPAAPKERADP